MTKAVKLSVHRNTIEQRRKRTLAKDATKRVEAIIRVHDVRAYAFVAIDAEGKMHATWDTGSVLPLWAFPATMAEGLSQDISQSNVDETWRPALPIKG